MYSGALDTPGERGVEQGPATLLRLGGGPRLAFVPQQNLPAAIPTRRARVPRYEHGSARLPPLQRTRIFTLEMSPFSMQIIHSL